MGKIGIRPKLIISFIGLSVVPIVLIGMFAITQSIKSIVEEVNFYSERVVNLVSKNIDLITNEIETEFVSIMRDADTIRAVERFNQHADDYSDYQKIIKTLEIINSGNDYIKSSMIVTPVQTFKAGSFTGMNEFTWNKLEENGVLKLVLESEKTFWLTGYKEEKEMIALKKIVHPNTLKTLGVGVLKVYRNNFQEQLNVLELNNMGAKVYLLDGEQNLLTSEEKSEIGQPIEIVHQQLFDDPTGFAFESPNTPIAGEENFVMYTTCNNNLWTVVMSNDKDELFKGVRNVQYMLGIISVVTTLIATAMGIIISFGVAKPIQTLMRGMQRAEQGDLLVAVKNRGSKEMSLLGYSFMNMVKNIRELIKQTQEVLHVVRSNAKDVEDMAANTKTASHQVSIAIQEIAAGASRQASEVQESMERLQNLTQSIGDVVSKIDDIKSVTEKTTQTSQTANQTINTLKIQTQASAEITGAIEKDIQELDEHASQIIEVIHLIEGISEQTNLLSLNAAIEAARAGNYGKGFGVVADEVRKLAIQSKEATTKIKKMVSTIQNQANQTVVGARKASEVFTEQRKVVGETTVAFEKIAIAMDEIRQEMAIINQVIAQMNTSRTETIDAIQTIQTVVEEVVAKTEELLEFSGDQMDNADTMNRTSSALIQNVNSLQENIHKFKV